MSPTRRKIIYTMIVVAFGILLMTIGVVIGMNLTTPNKTPNNEVEDNGDNDQGIDVGEPNPNIPDDDFDINDPLPDALEDTYVFESTRYNIQFSYPEALGLHEVTVSPNYFFNESISFENSNISATYVRIEGSAPFGIGVDKEEEGEVTTKQGYTGSYFITEPGADNNYFLTVMIPSPGSNGARIHFNSRAKTLTEAREELAIIQTILDDLEFDFSNVPLSGCETSCR